MSDKVVIGSDMERPKRFSAITNYLPLGVGAILLLINLVPHAAHFNLPETYGASVIQVGGIGVTLNEKTAYLPDGEGYLHPAEEYVFTSFNSGNGMWVSCREGYSLRSCSSETTDSVFGCYIEIQNTLQNRASITCSKKETP